MRRRWMLTGAWVLSTLAATLVAWGAVRLVADQVAPGTESPPPTAVALSDVDLAAGETQDPAGTPRARASQRPRVEPTKPATPARPARPVQRPGTAADDPGAADSAADDPPAQAPPADDQARQQPAAGDDDQEQEPVATTQAYDLVGGVVTVRYQGTTTRLVEASPNSGFVVEVQDGGPGKVDVRFRSDAHESRFVTRVRDGRPDPQREERPH